LSAHGWGVLGVLGYVRAAEKRWEGRAKARPYFSRSRTEVQRLHRWEIERVRSGHGNAVPLREFFAGAEGLVIVRIGQ
jgi:hypothetical protein